MKQGESDAQSPRRVLLSVAVAISIVAVFGLMVAGLMWLRSPVRQANAMQIVASAALNSGDYATAESVSEEATSLDPTNRGAWLTLGYARHHSAKWAGAYDAYDKANTIAGTPRAHVKEELAYAAWMQSLVLTKQQSHAEALTWMQRSVAEAPDDLDGILNLAACHYALEDWQQTFDIYTRVAKLAPDKQPSFAVYQAYVANMLGNAAYDRNDFPAALEWSLTGVKLTPSDPYAALAVANSQYHLDNWIESYTWYEKTDKLDAALGREQWKFKAYAAWMASNQYAHEGKFDEALMWMERSVTADDTDPTAYLNLAACYGSLRKWKLADEAAEKARALKVPIEKYNETRDWLDAERLADDGA